MAMPDNNEINHLLQMIKRINTRNKVFRFPCLGTQDDIPVESVNKPTVHFRITINRKSKISGKCTFLEIHGSSGVLLRLDIIGPAHTNPDGITISCPHIHIASGDYDTSWAYPLETAGIATFEDLISQLYEFMRYCNIINCNDFIIQSSL